MIKYSQNTTKIQNEEINKFMLITINENINVGYNMRIFRKSHLDK